MGSRTNFQLKDSQGSVWLYSHHGGDSKLNDLAYALDKAEPRWTDASYGIRIIVSQLIGDSWDSETGFGLSSYEAGEESYQPVCVDFTNYTVTCQEIVYEFVDFVKLFGRHLTNA